MQRNRFVGRADAHGARRGVLGARGYEADAQDARVDHIHSSTLEYRRTLTEQLLKLNQMIERMKRREVEETERQVKELRLQANQLKNEDE